MYLDIIHLGSTMQYSIVQHSAVHHVAAVGTIITQLAVAGDFLRLDRITPLLADHPVANSATDTDSHSVRDAVRKKSASIWILSTRVGVLLTSHKPLDMTVCKGRL